MSTFCNINDTEANVRNSLANLVRLRLKSSALGRWQLRQHEDEDSASLKSNAFKQPPGLQESDVGESFDSPNTISSPSTRSFLKKRDKYSRMPTQKSITVDSAKVEKDDLDLSDFEVDESSRQETFIADHNDASPIGASRACDGKCSRWADKSKSVAIIRKGGSAPSLGNLLASRPKPKIIRILSGKAGNHVRSSDLQEVSILHSRWDESPSPVESLKSKTFVSKKVSSSRAVCLKAKSTRTMALVDVSASDSERHYQEDLNKAILGLAAVRTFLLDDSNVSSSSKLAEMETLKKAQRHIIKKSMNNLAQSSQHESQDEPKRTAHRKTDSATDLVKMMLVGSRPETAALRSAQVTSKSRSSGDLPSSSSSSNKAMLLKRTTSAYCITDSPYSRSPPRKKRERRSRGRDHQVQDISPTRGIVRKAPSAPSLSRWESN